MTNELAIFLGNLETHFRAHYADFSIPDYFKGVTAEIGGKFARIVVTTAQTQAYAFVALVDGENKELGAFKAGEIFKCAGWKAPAKHARGSLWDDAGGLGCCGPYGVEYLRGGGGYGWKNN